MQVDYHNQLKLRLAFLTLLGLLFAFPSYSQEDTHGEPEFWFLFLSHFELNEQWKIGNEVHIRRTRLIKDNKQFILRPFVNYKPGRHITYSFGYSYIKTQPYGKYPLPAPLPEHNIWEQVKIDQVLGNTTISHRYRMEHRFRGNLVESTSNQFEVAGYNFSNRFRYRITLKRPISTRYFIQAFDEIWIAADSKFRQFFYNQNWIYLGLGRMIPHGNIQLAYLFQHTNGLEIVERHQTLQATFQYDF